MYLTGSKAVSMDAQSRITLPAEYRDEFKADGNKVCLVPFDGALWGFTPEGHQAWVEGFFPEGFDPRDANDRKLRLRLDALTRTVDIDKSGRLPLGKVEPAFLERLGLERDVVVVGDADHIAIWNAGRWDEMVTEMLADGALEDLLAG